MFGHSAEDGLHILEYLNFRDLSQEEEKIFRERWKDAYHKAKKKPLLATQLLYVYTLPSLCDDGGGRSATISQTRFLQFSAKSKESGLASRLDQGISLSSALKVAYSRI